ncbi:MAG: hypothetical protein PHT12_01460 [Patescibacteria group bacterium]|nr:hypothetical protein [Patescibacteria group bacterium]
MYFSSPYWLEDRPQPDPYANRCDDPEDDDLRPVTHTEFPEIEAPPASEANGRSYLIASVRLHGEARSKVVLWVGNQGESSRDLLTRMKAHPGVAVNHDHRTGVGSPVVHAIDGGGLAVGAKLIFASCGGLLWLRGNASMEAVAEALGKAYPNHEVRAVPATPQHQRYTREPTLRASKTRSR